MEKLCCSIWICSYTTYVSGLDRKNLCCIYISHKQRHSFTSRNQCKQALPQPHTHLCMQASTLVHTHTLTHSYTRSLHICMYTQTVQSQISKRMLPLQECTSLQLVYFVSKVQIIMVLQYVEATLSVMVCVSFSHKLQSFQSL